MLVKQLQPKSITDVVENIDLYLGEMRRAGNTSEIPKELNNYTRNFFREVNPDKEKLKSLAIYLADHIYRYAAGVQLTDDYTRFYFANVLAELWDTIQSRGVDTFYILDNTMRNDRFHTAIQLFALTGMAVVTPYVVLGKYMSYMSIEEQGKWVLSFGGEAFDPKTVTMTMDSSVNAREGEVVDLLKKYMELKRNIVYIEKDDSISFLKTVIDISKNSTYAGFLRNRAPEDPNVIAIQK